MKTTIGKSFLSQGPSPREQLEAMKKRVAEYEHNEQREKAAIGLGKLLAVFEASNPSTVERTTAT